MLVNLPIGNWTGHVDEYPTHEQGNDSIGDNDINIL